MATDLDMALLRTLVAIVDHGGFTRAARRLHRSQPAVSLQVKRLEALAGVALFRREGRGARLTEEGEALLVHARRILTLNDDALVALGRARLEGRLRLGSSQAFTERFLPQLLNRFARVHPDLQLEVRIDGAESLAAATRAGDLDLALVIQPPGRGGEPLARVPMGWVVGEGHSWADAELLPLALFDSPCPFRDLTLEALEGQGGRWRIAYTSPSLPGLFAAVRAGLGVTAQPRLAVPHALQVISTHHRLPALPPVEVALHRHPRRRGPAADRLAAVLGDAVAEHLEPLAA